MMLGLKLLLFLVIIIFVAIFSSQNNDPIALKFFTYEFPDISLAIVIFGALLLGFISGLIPASIRIVMLKRHVQRLEDFMELKEKTSHKPTPGSLNR
jgi:uncharacterized integral membrane protein